MPKTSFSVSNVILISPRGRVRRFAPKPGNQLPSYLDAEEGGGNSNTVNRPRDTSAGRGVTVQEAKLGTAELRQLRLDGLEPQAGGRTDSTTFLKSPV